MRKFHRYACCLGLLGLSAAVPASAMEGVEYFSKVRAQAGTQDKGGQRNAFGVGFGAGFQAIGGRVEVELGYQNVPGSIYRADILANSLGANPSNSIVTHRNTTDMLGFRGQYSRPLAQDWTLHGGLGLYRFKSRLETVGSFTVTGVAHPDGAWNTTPEESGVTFLPFAGVGYQLSDSGAFEFNVVLFKYKQADVAPVFTGLSADASNDYRRVVPRYFSTSVADFKLELTYVVRF